MFSKWATGYSGCDGGDIGSPQNKCIWFCGIEWGGGHPPDEQKLQEIFSEDVGKPPEGYTDDDDKPAWKHNLEFIFNWQAMKLLAAINGQLVTSYKLFAENTRPFVKDEKGYYKLNLYPLAFKDTSHQLWEEGFAKATGIQNKQSYLEWIRSNRFPVMKAWVESSMPSLIVCVGITYLQDFASAFVDDSLSFNQEIIDDRKFNWVVTQKGTLVVVIPFMVNRYGLTRNDSIQRFGDRIRELRLQTNLMLS